MLFEQIQECFIGDFLKVLHAVVGEEIKSMPRLVVELNTFTGHRRFFANIGVDILSTIGSPECSMEQIALSGIYGTGPVAALLRNGSGGGAACEGLQDDRLRHTADLGRHGASLRGRRDTTRQPRQVEIRRKTRYFHAGEAAARRPDLPVRLGLYSFHEGRRRRSARCPHHHDAATYPGLVLKCRPIGVLEVAQSTKQKKERNDRIFAVPDRSPFEGDLQDIRHLPRRAIEELEKFFEATDALETKTLTFKGWHGPGRATKTIRKASI